MLEKILASGRLSTAYLLAGPEGSEKETQGKRLAQALLCETQRACDTCPPCRRFLTGNHPDFLLLVPQKGSLKIEEIRQTAARLAFKPVEGKRLIIFIQDADRMTLGAANALLKSLEEPPPYALFLLASAVPDVLPATIRSRCQRISFFPLPGAAEKKWAPLIPFWREKVFPFLNRSPSTFAEASEIVEGLLRETDEVLPFLDLMKTWWRDLVVFRETRDAATLKFAGAGETEAALERRSPGRLFAELDAILETERAIEGNVQKQLALERLFLHLEDPS